MHNTKPKFIVTQVLSLEENKNVIDAIRRTISSRPDTVMPENGNFGICKAELNCRVIHGLYINETNEHFEKREAIVSLMELELSKRWGEAQGFSSELYLNLKLNKSERPIQFSLRKRHTLFNYKDPAVRTPAKGICQLTNPNGSIHKPLRNVIWFRDGGIYDEISHIVQSEIQHLNGELKQNYFNFNFSR